MRTKSNVEAGGAGGGGSRGEGKVPAFSFQHLSRNWDRFEVVPSTEIEKVTR
jgi:hypothetical protein